MTPELRRHGFCANHKRVERLMPEHGIVGVTPRRRVRRTIRDDLAPPLPDLIGRDFSPGAPNTRYCGDITYVPTAGAGSTWPPSSISGAGGSAAGRWPARRSGSR